MTHDILEGLDRDIWDRNVGIDEVLSDKLLQGLCVELVLQLLEELGKLCNNG